MTIDRETARRQLQAFEFKRLFVESMGWSLVPGAKLAPFSADGGEFTRTPIAHMSGVMVYEVAPAKGTSPIPGAKTRRAIHKLIEPLAHEHLLIFVDDAAPAKRTQSLWSWLKRENGKHIPREHLFVRGQPGDLFLSKIDGLVIELDELREDGTVPIVTVTNRLAASLDVERVTKRFYTEFSSLRVEFIDQIQGIPREADRFWYASVLLNRLMFVYFLQKRGFIQANTRYLDQKLDESAQRGPDRFYAVFLHALFFEGFAQPEDQRSPEARALLGDIKYLNGGLFLKHRLEEDYPAIHIPDDAFRSVLALFGRYSWHLDDTPGAQDNEINPDVLGYIFEKYINQKAFGAYYTRTEITQYLCERTIHAVVVAQVNAVTGGGYEDISDILLRLDAPLCRHMLSILSRLTILDPACGSGAFLVAAMKTMLDLYSAVFGKIEFLNDTNLTAALNKFRARHASLNYAMRKQIIADNLFGVDIMDEATEIARLRLFLFLVSSAQTVDQLEPLPNIDFNIMAGNSLIGLLNVNEQRFNAQAQLELFQGGKAQQYRDLLTEKNRLIALYRSTSSVADDLTSLRHAIERHKQTACAALDEILLDDFQALGVRFEQAQPSGKPKKRPVELADITALAPFHWGFDFDEILGARGGFDVILTNPPWEVFQTDEKEFFQRFDDLIQKKKLDIKTWEKQRDEMLKDPEILRAWLDYASSYSHVSQYFKSAPQYAYQRSEVDGRSVARKINLYALFTEQCFNLLRQGGRCGIVIPSGIYTDLGAKQLREMLFERTRISGLFGFENRKEIFEGVHRSFKFVVLTYEKGGQTEAFPAAFMRHEVAELDRFPGSGGLPIRVELIRRTSPDSLSVMEFKSTLDIAITEKMLRFPLLGEDVPGAWSVKFSQEFNMTSDSGLFYTSPAPGRLPLYEGKMIHQFTHQWGEGKYWLDEREARRALIGRNKDVGQKLAYQGYRLVFRDIARNTDERTAISTVIQPGVFCNHPLPYARFETEASQSPHACALLLSSLLNTFCVDYLFRQRVTAHLTFFIVYNVSIPRLTAADPFFAPLVERAARLICTTPEFDALAQEINLTPLPPLRTQERGSEGARYGVVDAAERAKLRAEIDGMVAHLYGLTEAEFVHILGTFPLVAQEVKDAALTAYRAG